MVQGVIQRAHTVRCRQLGAMKVYSFTSAEVNEKQVMHRFPRIYYVLN